jgi:hypothetical protein
MENCLAPFKVGDKVKITEASFELMRKSNEEKNFPVKSYLKEAEKVIDLEGFVMDIYDDIGYMLIGIQGRVFSVPFESAAWFEKVNGFCPIGLKAGESLNMIVGGL